MKCDTHVHSNNSHDGKLPISQIVEIAKAQGLCYLATTHHPDSDFKNDKNRAPASWPNPDPEKYHKDRNSAKQALAEDKNNTVNLCFGIEASYDSSQAAKEA